MRLTVWIEGVAAVARKGTGNTVMGGAGSGIGVLVAKELGVVAPELVDVPGVVARLDAGDCVIEDRRLCVCDLGNTARVWRSSLTS